VDLTSRWIARAMVLALLSGGVAMATETDAPYGFTLPESWRDVSEPDVVAYESPDKQQQLVVGEYVLKKKLSQAELRALLERFIDTRRQAEIGLSKGEASIGSPSFVVEPAVIKAEYWGSRQASRYHSATIVWATANRIVSWRFEATDKAALLETVGRVRPTMKVK
jgi:hypothetical protein